MGRVGQSGRVVHNFDRALAASHAEADRAYWEDVYRRAFGSLFQSMDRPIKANGLAQQMGVDRVVTLTTSMTVRIDEKVRAVDYGDILLETLSDRDRKTPGWVIKELFCDFIAYAVEPSRRCYFLPVVQLQSAWREHGADWTKEFGTREAENRDGGRRWITVNTPVPVRVLYSAIGDQFRVTWGAETNEVPLSLPTADEDARARLIEDCNFYSSEPMTCSLCGLFIPPRTPHRCRLF